MYLCESAVGTFPKFGVRHCSEEISDLFSLIFRICLDLQSIDLLQYLGFFVQKLLHSQSLFLGIQLTAALDLFGLVESPGLQLIIQNLEVFAGLWMHAPLDLFLVLSFLLSLQLLLQSKQLVFSILLSFSQVKAAFTCKVSPDTALDIQGGLFSLLEPHDRAEVAFRVNDFIVALVQEQASFLHLSALLAHHVRRLGLVLVGLNLSLVLVWVIVDNLIRLREGMVVGNACAVVSVTAKVGFRTLLLLDFNCNDLDLVVTQANLNFKLVWHDEFVCFNRVVIVLLLLLLVVVGLLLLLLLLLLIVFLMHLLKRESGLNWVGSSLLLVD